VQVFGADAELFGQPLHVGDILFFIGVDAAAQEQPMRALQGLDDARGGAGLFNRQRLALAGRGRKAQHDQVGVGVPENIAQKSIRAEALQAIESARQRGGRAALGFEAGQRSRAGRLALGPRAGRVYEAALHVEDEFAAADRCLRDALLKRRFGWNG